MKRAILFDLDGTLIDSAADLTAAVNALRKSFSLPPLPEDMVKGYVGDGVVMLIRRSLPDVEFDEAEAIGRMREIYLANSLTATRTYPGVETGLEQLRRAGWILGVVTNKPQAAAEAVLEKLGLRQYFSGVIGDGALPLKPAPDGCLELLRRFKAAPAASFMLGDHCADLAAARSAGMRAVLAAWGIGRPAGEPFEYAAGDFADFVRYIQSAQGETP